MKNPAQMWGSWWYAYKNVSVCTYLAVLICHEFVVCLCSVSRTVGIFWMNVAETWIDIDTGSAKQVIDKLCIEFGFYKLFDLFPLLVTLTRQFV